MVLTRLDIWNIIAYKRDLIPTLKEIFNYASLPKDLGKQKADEDESGEVNMHRWYVAWYLFCRPWRRSHIRVLYRIVK